MIKIKSNKNLRFNFKDNAIHFSDDIRKDLRNDKGLWMAFKANIAIQFQDHYRSYKKIYNKKYLTTEDIHKISNDAAEAFLNLWTHIDFNN